GATGVQCKGCAAPALIPLNQSPMPAAWPPAAAPGGAATGVPGRPAPGPPAAPPPPGRPGAGGVAAALGASRRLSKSSPFLVKNWSEASSLVPVVLPGN